MAKPLKFFAGPLTWAYAIIVGGSLLITPNGIVHINTKILIAIGVIGVLLGVIGFFSHSK